jgi:hypothetical protein
LPPTDFASLADYLLSQETSQRAWKPDPAPYNTPLTADLIAWLLPLLGPIFLLIAFCTLLPCLLKFLQTQVNKISNQTFNQLLLQGYQPLIAQPEDTYNGPYQDTRL